MDRNDQERFLSMRNTGYSAQAPEGVGPVAPGPAGVLSPEAIARMLAYEEELRRQKTVPELQHTPIEEIVAKFSGNAPQPAVIGPQAGFQPSSPVPSDQPDFSNPARTLPSKPKVKQPTEEAPKPQEQQATTTDETTSPGPVADPTTQVAQQEIQKAVSETVKTPEDEQRLLNALNRPTEDGTQSIAQRIAMIAMAVAPTAVGFALEGRKGAYLGAAATGKGLQEGVEAYGKEEAAARAERKLDIEARKAEKAAKAAAERNAFDKMFVDQEGRKWFYDADNQIQPVMIPSGPNGEKIQAREANVPIESYNPMTQQWSSRMKFEGPASQTGSTVPITTLKDEIADARSSAVEMKIPKGLFVPKELDDLAAKYPNASMSGPKPDGISTQDWTRLKSTYAMWRDKKEKQIERFQDKNFDLANKPAKGKQPSIQEKSQVKAYENDVTYWNKEEFWKKYQEKQAAAESFFNRPVNEIVSGVKDAAIWMTYMKEVQQDQSVVREGDMNTVQSFLAMKQRIGSFLNQYAAGKSRMTESLRKDILDYLGEIRRIKEKNAMLAVNTMVKKGIELGYQKPIVSSVALGEARDWFAKKGQGRVVGMAAGTDIWKKRIPEMVFSGQLKNGDVVRDTDGDSYIVRLLDLGNGKVAVKTTYWAVP